MAHPNFDLSEYRNSEHANYRSQWSGCEDLSPSFFENSVSYLEKEKRLYLEVSPVYEFECMFDLYEDLEYPIPEAYQREVAEAEVESWRTDLQKPGKSLAAFSVYSRRTRSIPMTRQSRESTHSAARQLSCRWAWAS